MQCISNSELRLTCSEQELCTFMSVSNTISAPADSSLKQPVYGTSHTLRKTDAVQHRFLTAESVLTIFGIKTSVLVVCSAAEQFQLPLELREKKIIKTLLVESVVLCLYRLLWKEPLRGLQNTSRSQVKETNRVCLSKQDLATYSSTQRPQ